MNSCQFCNENSESLIFESNHCNAYIFKTCIKHGHFVVSPKKHLSSFVELSAEQILDLFITAQKIIKRMIIITGAEKYYIASIGDSGSHFHVHFIPKLKDDPMLGEYIFSDKGWKGNLVEAWPDAKFNLNIEEFRNVLKETDYELSSKK